jgi:hypothetical protein
VDKTKEASHYGPLDDSRRKNLVISRRRLVHVRLYVKKSSLIHHGVVTGILSTPSVAIIVAFERNGEGVSASLRCTRLKPNKTRSSGDNNHKLWSVHRVARTEKKSGDRCTILHGMVRLSLHDNDKTTKLAKSIQVYVRLLEK